MPKHINHKYTNHLINETSPYLLQHAHNPVQWYSWGEEALQKAKDEDKLIFISIGYSTCHWCHVMAHESFEDEAVARILNEQYVCIKVDREERPDLDAIYMNFCQLMTGSGGWPLNLWLTPEQRPIYAGTYFPKNDAYGRTGFISVLTHLHKMWQDDRDELMDKSLAIVAHVNNHGAPNPEAVDQFVTVQAVRELKERFDDVYGGFGGAPKFPSPHQLLYLMHDHIKHPNDSTMAMVTKTLDSMYAGGIYDHIGGGFARYSVDGQWLVPHFEKMLYDNALLLRTYNLAYQITKEPLYKAIAYDILRFLKREMHSVGGGFFTALDADSEGVEGKCYVFTTNQITEVLDQESQAYCERFDISQRGNFEGENIPNLIGKDISEPLFRHYQDNQDQLLTYREKRIQPSKDEKILTSVNGLLLGSLSHMYRLYEDEEVLTLAKGIASHIENNVYSEGRLKGSMTNGQLGPEGVLEDYAFVIEGTIELYQATFDPSYLEVAEKLTDTLNKEFWDREDGGYYMTSESHEALITRPKECYDSAIPSGNSVMGLNLMKLSRFKDSLEEQKRFDALIKAFGKRIKQGPSYFCYMMIGLLYRQQGTRDLVIAAPEGMKLSSDSRYIDYFTLRQAIQGEDKKPIDDEVTYYVCEDFACQQPMKILKE